MPQALRFGFALQVIGCSSVLPTFSSSVALTGRADRRAILSGDSRSEFCDLACGVRVRQLPGSLAHGAKARTVREQADDLLRKPFRIQFRFFHQYCGMVARQQFGIFELVIVGGAGEGNKKSRFSRGSDFGHSARA